MKKLALVLVVTIALAFTVGCSKEWYKHDTVYKTNDHMFFSISGYQDASSEDLQTQEEQGGWWGKPVNVVQE